MSRYAMSLSWNILGRPGADNAVLVTVDSGHSQDRILFDCGENCLGSLRISELQAVDHLCFSHFHMDHVCGFDTFFRHNYNRPFGPVQVWGPPQVRDVLHHRFRSFTWNLHADQPGEWIVREWDGSTVDSSRFLTREAFATAHELPSSESPDGLLFKDDNFELQCRLLPHATTSSAAYRIVESDRRNVCPEALQECEWLPGKWLQDLTNDDLPDDHLVEEEGSTRPLGELRDALLTTSPGESIAYLTDFRLEPGSEEWDELVDWLEGTGTLICECQYRFEDLSLARKHGHMTAKETGQLARSANVGQLVLHHLSRRYLQHEWTEMKREAGKEFGEVIFPRDWSDFVPG